MILYILQVYKLIRQIGEVFFPKELVMGNQLTSIWDVYMTHHLFFDANLTVATALLKYYICPTLKGEIIEFFQG